MGEDKTYNKLIEHVERDQVIPETAGSWTHSGWTDSLTERGAGSKAFG